VYSMVQRREKEKDSRYIQEASAPAAAPCIRPVTCLRHKYTCNILQVVNASDTLYTLVYIPAATYSNLSILYITS